MALHRLPVTVLSDNQKVALVLSKSGTATLSLIASSIIIFKIYLRCNTKVKSNVANSGVRSTINDGGMTTYYRMLLIISILDVLHSISSSLSSLMVPSYTNSTFAHGTTATCSIQGAFQQLTPTIVLYMAMLNTYFMLKIRYNVSDAIVKNRYELWFHAIPLLHFFSTAITGLSMGIYGPIVISELGCWLDSFCVATNTCTRSGPLFYNYIDYYAWSFAYIWLFICVFIVSINAVLIYTAILKQEKRNERYLGARLQNESVNVAAHSFASRSLQDFNIGGDHDESAPDMPSVAHISSCRNMILENNIEAGSKEIDTESIELPVPEQAPEIYTDQNHCNKGCTFNSSFTSLHSRGERSTQKIKQSRVVAVQSMLYVASALFTAVWIFMPWVGQKLDMSTQWRFFFAFMTNIFSPSQGLFNLFIFVRLHYLRLRESNKDWSRWKCMKKCILSSN